MRLLFVYLAILSFLTLNPWLRPDDSPAFADLDWDKIDHAFAYGILAWLMLLASKFYKKLWLSSLMVFLISGGIGLFLEYCQLWLTTNCSFSYGDALANVLGALLGVILFGCYRAFVNRRRLRN